MKKSTNNVELVETDNIRKSLNRLWTLPGSRPCCRAIRNALEMSNASTDDRVRRIREALELP